MKSRANLFIVTCFILIDIHQLIRILNTYCQSWTLNDDTHDHRWLLPTQPHYHQSQYYCHSYNHHIERYRRRRNTSTPPARIHCVNFLPCQSRENARGKEMPTDDWKLGDLEGVTKTKFQCCRIVWMGPEHLQYNFYIIFIKMKRKENSKKWLDISKNAFLFITNWWERFLLQDLDSSNSRSKS